MDVSVSQAHWIMGVGIGLTWCVFVGVILWRRRIARLTPPVTSGRILDDIIAEAISPQERAWREFQARAEVAGLRETFNAGMQAGIRYALSQVEWDIQERAARNAVNDTAGA
jgi:hypothetical protein